MKENNISEKLHMQFYKWNKLLKRNVFEQKLEHFKAVPYKGQGKILKLLLDNGEMSQKDIVIEMDIRPSTVWELVGKLERAGFVEKIQNPDDKRGSIIKLTESGIQEARSAKWNLNNISYELYSALSSDEQYQLSELLDKLILSLKKSETDSEVEADFDFVSKSEEMRFDEKLCKDLGIDFKKDFHESRAFFKELFNDLGMAKKFGAKHRKNCDCHSSEQTEKPAKDESDIEHSDPDEL